MPFIEAPTTFYMGRGYDPDSRKLTDEIVYYDSRDLTTHAVVLGMTGSGKTGLCITLLEEAILDNIPAIIIDPKGDITNLLLTFPDLLPQDFQPWINIDDARRAGMDVPAFAADIAQRWKDGLQSWGIVPDRIRWLQMASKYSIFTPGSDAGLPISIVASLRAPREGWAGNEEAVREKINALTTALLALIGMSAEPLKDREHVLIANIFEHNWQMGRDLTLEDIILQVQKPPFNKLGVFPIDQYMAEKARFKLAMDLNSIIAAPTFQSWLQGHPLDIQSLLYQPNGRPRVSIFYTAHLSEAERMFITTLILESMLGWMRNLSGTTSLRALLYVDEMFGYFPPYPRNPPTKDPMLRLLKQARAFGIGVILATQNPGDLDYKGLTNAGTWFIGRLQSDNDRQKVMAGLESMASATENMNLKDVERLIADIMPRVFLMRNVHDDGGPVLMHTRWAMSYLRGPLTRQQIQVLMKYQRQELIMRAAQQYGEQTGGYGTQPQVPTQMPGAQGMPAASPGAPPPPPSLPGHAATFSAFAAQSAPQPPTVMPGQIHHPMPFNQTQFPTASPSDSQVTSSQALSVRDPNLPTELSANQPPVSAAVSQYFLPTRLTSQQAIGQWERRTQRSAQSHSGVTLTYQPMLLAQAVVRYQDRKASIYTARIYTYVVPGLQRAGLIHWEDYLVDPLEARLLSGKPFEQALFGDLPSGLTDDQRMKALQREMIDMLYNTALLTVPFNPDLKIYGNPDTEFSEYQAAVYQAAREKRDAEMDKTSAKYAAMMQKLEQRYKKKEQELRAEKKEIQDRRREELFTTGEALLSLWKGRTNYTLSRMSRAGRYKRQTKEDITESYETLEIMENEMATVEQQYESEIKAINERWAQAAARTEDYVINPLKKDIQLELFGIGWIPAWYVVINGQPTAIEAY